jgi:hypothetical protein
MQVKRTQLVAVTNTCSWLLLYQPNRSAAHFLTAQARP